MQRIGIQLVNRTGMQQLDNLAIIQENLSADFDKLVVWQLLSVGKDPVDIYYSDEIEIHVTDEFGNESETIETEPGQAFEFRQVGMDNKLLTADRPAALLAETEIHNKLEYGDVSAHIYKDGKPVAIWTQLAPWECATFSFRPRFWIGHLPGYEEGDLIDIITVKQHCSEVLLDAFGNATIAIHHANKSGELRLEVSALSPDRQGAKVSH
jgi:hypothetical protein